MIIAKSMKKKLISLLLLFLPVCMWAGDNDDFGTWLELGAKKSLPRNWSVGLESELRTVDNSSMVDRVSVGANLDYRVHKYLKLSAGYAILFDYNTENAGKKWLTPKYWAHRNRFFVDANSSVKLWKWLRVSGRLRYQFTHRAAQHIERYECEGMDANTGQYVYDMDEANIKLKDCESRQVLRSRVKFEVDKKHLDWSPFVAVEFHNNVAVGEHMNFDKLRTSVGTSYKIDKRNDVSLSYVMTLDRTSHPYQALHALSVGYSYDF